MESSRRDFSYDMAEHWPTSKSNQNTHHPRFGFTPKTGIAFPKTGVLFSLGAATAGATFRRHPNGEITKRSTT